MWRLLVKKYVKLYSALQIYGENLPPDAGQKTENPQGGKCRKMLDNLFGLHGKTALVTGGATGIGRMAAEGLVAAGARVLIASRKGPACAAVAEELNARGYPGRAEGFSGDVATQEGIAALVDDVSARTDKLNILMNNAGRSWGAPVEDFPYDGWSKIFDLNVTGMFELTRRLIPLLEATASQDDPARVVNVGSIMGDIPKGGDAVSYAVSKGAVHHMTRVLANEFTPRFITVNAIAPGPFLSNMTSFAISTEEGQNRAAQGVPIGRVGRPEDIAGALLYLCGRGGAYVSGAILPLSGGMNSHSTGTLFGGNAE